MKKEYSAPSLMIERFVFEDILTNELSGTISNDGHIDGDEWGFGENDNDE